MERRGERKIVSYTASRPASSDASSWLPGRQQACQRSRANCRSNGLVPVRGLHRRQQACIVTYLAPRGSRTTEGEPRSSGGEARRRQEGEATAQRVKEWGARWRSRNQRRGRRRWASMSYRRIYSFYTIKHIGQVFIRKRIKNFSNSL